MTAKRFQVALFFPGEHRDYVSQVAEILAKSLGQSRVFYDEWHSTRQNWRVLIWMCCCSRFTTIIQN